MSIQTEKLYEVAYLVSPDVDEAGASALKNEIYQLIVKLGGSVREEFLILRRRLAYPVKKFSSAYLISGYIMLTPENQKALAKELRIHPHILRQLLITLTEKSFKRLREKRIPQLPTVTREAKEKVLARRPSAMPKTEKPAEEKKADIAEIERKLDEILGREL